MWAEFEWENKVAISTSIHDLLEFLNHIVKSTNMTCLTPHESEEQGSFLAANLYARRYVLRFTLVISLLACCPGGWRVCF
jgi:vesicle coat complex subunit